MGKESGSIDHSVNNVHMRNTHRPNPVSCRWDCLPHLPDLPDGAEIKRVAAIYYDNSVLTDIHIGIGAIKPFDTSEPEFMVHFTSEGLGNEDALRTFNTTTITDPIIDNKNIYFAMVEFDMDTFGDVAFRGLWIAYE